MSLVLPRFNQEFVRNVEPGSPQARFVSAVGDYTFLGRLYADRVAAVEVELRHPVTLNLFESEEAYTAFVNGYSANFESLLINEGLEELVFSLNSLKVAVDSLRNKKISWVESTFKPEMQNVVNGAYIVGSNVGFGFHSFSNPALDVIVSDEGIEDDAYSVSLPHMWDIKVQ